MNKRINQILYKLEQEHRNWSTNTTQTKLQEVIFDLYDVYNGKITKLSREYARELAEKLEEVEERMFNPRNTIL